MEGVGRSILDRMVGSRAEDLGKYSVDWMVSRRQEGRTVWMADLSMESRWGEAPPSPPADSTRISMGRKFVRRVFMRLRRTSSANWPVGGYRMMQAVVGFGKC